jgi:hypothetical protein
MLLVYEALISVYGSARQVDAELAHPTVWELVCGIVQETVGVDLPAEPMWRHHYLYGRNRHLSDPVVLAELAEIHRKVAADQARELGLLDENGPGSWTHPDPTRVVYGDGKVVTPLFKAKARCDPRQQDHRRDQDASRGP